MSPLILLRPSNGASAAHGAERALLRHASKQGYLALSIDASASSDPLATLEGQLAAVASVERGEVATKLAAWEWARHLDDLHVITNRPILIVISEFDAIAELHEADAICANIRSAIRQRRRWFYVVMSGIAAGPLDRWLKDFDHPIYELGPVEYLQED